MGISTRDDLVSALRKAAELEHAFVCQYLFAAYSLKSYDDPTLVSLDEKEAVRRFQATLLFIARQEMEHLTVVNNVLLLMGEPPHFAVPLFPHTSATGQDLHLLPFGEEALNAFIAAERGPTHAGGGGTSGSYYRPIFHALLELPIEDLFRGTVGDAVTSADVVQSDPVRTFARSGIDVPEMNLVTPPGIRRQSSLHALLRLIEQGEGMGVPSSEDDSHHGRMMQALWDLSDLRQARSGFEPSRPFAKNPSRQERAGVTQVRDPGARACMEIFDGIYRVALLALHRFFASPGSADNTVRKRGKERLRALVFTPIMKMLLKPAALATSLFPVDASSTSALAAPAFEAGLTPLDFADFAGLTQADMVHDVTRRLRDLADQVRRVEATALSAPALKRLAVDIDLCLHNAALVERPGPVARASSIVLHFSGWFQCRMPTDPDHPDERWGVEGYTFAFAGEEELDGIIRLNGPRCERAPGPPTPIGVRVDRVSLDNRPINGHAWLGAEVQLLDDPRFVGRNGLIVDELDTFVHPFHMQVQKGDVVLTLFDELAPVAGADEQLVQASAAQLARRKSIGMVKPEEVLATSGITHVVEGHDLPPVDIASEYRKLRNRQLREAINAGGPEVLQARLDAHFQDPRHLVLLRTGYRFRYEVNGRKELIDPSNAHRLDDCKPWTVEFWLGAWDGDALAGFMDGTITLPLSKDDA